jgi:DNA primase
MIPNDFIQTLLSRVDIVEVVERYVHLKKAGANYAACCPFHGEKTPSFTVSPTKQFYHCFGCGAHGTAISFLMEHTGRGFVEAVEDLAGSVGLTVPRVSGSRGPTEPSERGPDLHALLLAAARFYRHQLKAAPRAIAYLKGRGLTGEIAARYGMGYAPMGWQPLAEAWPDYGDAALEAAGLVIAGDGGKRYDRFRDRIMFPIHDVQGRVIGFGGRVIDAGEPKYLNSPETPVFSKGRELYGLYQARQAIRNNGQVVVVEGYMDVVALAQHGIDYAVATLGTATTPAHVQKLFRQTDRVVFCFDGDAAGQRAAWRALENALPALSDGKSVHFLFLPVEDDPDTYVRARGKAAFERLLQDALPLSEYFVRELVTRHPPATAEGRAALLAAARPLLAELAAPLLAGLLRKRLAELTELGEKEVGRLLPSEAPAPLRSPRPGTARLAPSLDRRMLQILLLRPDLGARFEAPLPASAEPERAALSKLIEFLRERAAQTSNTAAILEAFRDSPHEPLLQAVAAQIMNLDDGFDFDDEFTGALKRYRDAERTDQIAPLLQRSSVSELSNDDRERLLAGLRRERPGEAVSDPVDATELGNSG